MPPSRPSTGRAAASVRASPSSSWSPPRSPSALAAALAAKARPRRSPPASARGWAICSHLDDHDRRIAVAAGIGSGIGSIFKAPFGGALSSAEVLYKRDFEADALSSFIASVIGFSIYGVWAGWTPVFGWAAISASTSRVPLVGFPSLGITAGASACSIPGRCTASAGFLQESARAQPVQAGDRWPAGRADRRRISRRPSAWATVMSSSPSTATSCIWPRGLMAGSRLHQDPDDFAHHRLGRQRRSLRSRNGHRRLSGRCALGGACMPLPRCWWLARPWAPLRSSAWARSSAASPRPHSPSF